MSDEKKEEAKRRALALALTPERALPMLQDMMILMSAVLSTHAEMLEDIARKDVNGFVGRFQSIAHGLPNSLKDMFEKHGASQVDAPLGDGSAKLETELVNKVVTKGTTTLH